VRNETPEELAVLKRHFRPSRRRSYIIDIFPVVRRKDEEKCKRDYQTKLLILEIYDEMAAAMRTGIPTKPASIHRQVRLLMIAAISSRSPNGNPANPSPMIGPLIFMHQRRPQKHECGCSQTKP